MPKKGKMVSNPVVCNQCGNDQYWKVMLNTGSKPAPGKEYLYPSVSLTMLYTELVCTKCGKKHLMTAKGEDLDIKCNNCNKIVIYGTRVIQPKIELPKPKSRSKKK